MYWVYVIRSETTGRFYIGYTANLKDRIRRHNRGYTQTTRRHPGPWALVYRESLESKTKAIRRERQIKRWKDRRLIERLIKNRLEAPVCLWQTRSD